MTTTKLLELDSAVRGESVPMSVVLPPDFDRTARLPLLISLHGGGADRQVLAEMHPVWDRLYRSGAIPPLVMVSFSSGPGSWYGGSWEQFVVEELPEWAATEFGVAIDRDNLVMTGISMGGYGTLKIAGKNPDRFAGIAAMEPAIEPSFDREADGKRNTWYRMEAMETEVWGSPLDEQAWLADNPATVIRNNAAAIRSSGLEIYLEVGDMDYINLHDGAEFVHRALWDHDIRHEYHLVRWADHVGKSFARRIPEAFSFLGSVLRGGLEEPTNLVLTDEEKAYLTWINEGGMARGDEAPMTNPMADPERAPSIHAGIWDPLKALSEDPDMTRNYARLPATGK